MSLANNLTLLTLLSMQRNKWRCCLALNRSSCGVLLTGWINSAQFFALIHWLSDEHNCQLSVAIFSSDTRLNSPQRCFAMYSRFEFMGKICNWFHFDFVCIGNAITIQNVWNKNRLFLHHLTFSDNYIKRIYFQLQTLNFKNNKQNM